MIEVSFSREQLATVVALLLVSGRKVQACKVLRDCTRWRSLRDALDLIHLVQGAGFSPESIAQAIVVEMEAHPAVWL